MSLSYGPPPSRWRLRQAEIHVCSVPLAASRDCTARFHEILSPDDLHRASRFKTAALTEAFVVGRGILRTILGTCLGVSPSDVCLAYGEWGKPRIYGVTRVRFNLSQAGGQALYAVALDCELGVDVEQIRPIPDSALIAGSFFNTAEKGDLMTVPAYRRDEAFLTCWTRKEAYVKAAGDGLRLPLDSFRVSLLGREAPQLDVPRDRREWSLYDVSPGQGYVAALVSQGSPIGIYGWEFGDSGECAEYFARQLGASTRIP